MSLTDQEEKYLKTRPPLTSIVRDPFRCKVCGLRGMGQLESICEGHRHDPCEKCYARIKSQLEPNKHSARIHNQEVFGFAGFFCEEVCDCNCHKEIVYDRFEDWDEPRRSLKEIIIENKKFDKEWEEYDAHWEKWNKIYDKKMKLRNQSKRMTEEEYDKKMKEYDKLND